MGEDDFRKLEQAWLMPLQSADLPSFEKCSRMTLMGTSFGGGVLSKSDVVPADGVPQDTCRNVR